MQIEPRKAAIQKVEPLLTGLSAGDLSLGFQDDQGEWHRHGTEGGMMASGFQDDQGEWHWRGADGTIHGLCASS